ncbi:MAG: hypothetical protein ABIY70_07025 [Capsulimonas sp.]|uniref:hypothetical protein n=1 Tax=Capsulimonas sp. TaxID=2494211 RepID=UPI0032672104
MTTNFFQRSAKRIVAGLVCVALLSQAVPTIGTAVADNYGDDDNAGTNALIIGAVGAVAYVAFAHPKKP